MDKGQNMENFIRLRLFLWVGTLGFFSPVLGEPRLPKEPNLPSLPMEESKEPRNARGEKDSTEPRVINLTLCDGRTVRGESSSGSQSMSFEHSKDGILYKKKLTVSELDSVRIDSWELKQKREEKKGITYEVVPKKIRIRTRNGEVFYKETGVSDLKLLNIEIKNNNGETTLFSYWVDLKYPDGKWYSGLPMIKQDQGTREDCLKDVVKMVEWE
ncbi:hypothetical protein [Leptospira vanthielii]|uniref:Uncharacterized protein n=1 Tax=Leptospira vanthielii serovar Holland str. Waz Holland = ATCC 700522 TaxID=1218591 RepID=N1WBM1_9LEPT|nr:hypothetical protein [Leptospira vanthielii]EMY70825.1 hypothetical protein LEP1GSC199_4025 [Leptospira vanthielii serovar Holland str. Waz Holland = ATCC 700522]